MPIMTRILGQLGWAEVESWDFSSDLYTGDRIPKASPASQGAHEQDAQLKQESVLADALVWDVCLPTKCLPNPLCATTYDTYSYVS